MQTIGLGSKIQDPVLAGHFRAEVRVPLLGDFNLIPAPIDAHNPEGWWGDALFRPESLERFRTLMNLGLTDALRSTTAEPSYTFWDFQAGAWRRNHGIRIDHLLLSPQAQDRLKTASIRPDVRSSVTTWPWYGGWSPM